MTEKSVDVVALTEELGSCRAAVAKQSMEVRTLKAQGGDKSTMQTAVDSLMGLKKRLAELEQAMLNTEPMYKRCRAQLENLARRRSIYFPAFDIYGGVAGLFDWGPMGCAVKAEVEALWRRHFILYEDMLEISGPCLTPHTVLKVSGHVDRFCDLICEDVVTSEQYRADKLLEDWIEYLVGTGIPKEEADKLELIKRQADGYTAGEMADLFTKLSVQSPAGNAVSNPIPFNLMFKTKIGPKEDSTASHDSTAYLRPETAQGIFVNFRRLLEYNQGKLPFAGAQIGLGFRNEIAPRNGLLRVREFLMGEIEHFVHPIEKQHSSFGDVADLHLPLYSRANQLGSGLVSYELTLREAVAKGVINNETLAYYMGRTFMFLQSCGIQDCGLRFRQHLPTEMAHYASDCWDAEVETSYGWVECVGHADRAAYDLDAHSTASKVPLVASRRLPEKITRQVLVCVANKGLMGPIFRQHNAAVQAKLEVLTDEEKRYMAETLKTSGKAAVVVNGETFELTKDMIEFKEESQIINEETFTPHVIEPSFGFGRIIYAMLEHTFRSRGMMDQEERCFFAFPVQVAPIKTSLLAISSDKRFDPFIARTQKLLKNAGIACKVDVSAATIGKRYARTDELGIPFGITFDFQTLNDDSVTIRERDSMRQVRVPSVVAAVEEVLGLVRLERTWEDVQRQFPTFTQQEIDF